MKHGNSVAVPDYGWQTMLAPYDPIAELYDGYPGDYLEDIVFFAEEAIAFPAALCWRSAAGTGRLSLCLAAVGVEVVGIDASVEVLHVFSAQTRAASAPARAGVADRGGHAEFRAAPEVPARDRPVPDLPLSVDQRRPGSGPCVRFGRISPRAAS